MANLLIVESPAKAKTIKKYLGKGYEVIASMGHVRDLPASRLSVDVKNNFEPKYKVIKGREQLVKDLNKLAKKSDKVFLATDPDREGEAISWHLAFLLGLDLNDKNRVTFNEITKAGIKAGMQNPRNIDLDLVNAQQARRILDRLVGYKLSPFLCSKIRKGLSAGRVQSVAVKIIMDREDEIRKFKPEEYWTIDGMFVPNGKKRAFPATFYGDKNGKIKITNKDEADKILKDLQGACYTISNITKGQRKRNPAPPFITSTLQQDASRKLGFQPRRTMKVAQELYEGVEAGKLGAVGLITYMRTDSLRISEDAIKEAKECILEKWGNKYLPEKSRRFKVKANAQDGHEAIRPTMPKFSPDEAKQFLTSDQYKLYKLIWERFIACQMASCILDTVKVDISAKDYVFKTSGYTVNFDGFTVLYEEGKDQKEENKKSLPNLEPNTSLTAKSIVPNQHFTEPPPRFTDASLIKALEEYGIGRPSTYAATITTITSREYVIHEGKALKPTELGEVTNNLMKEQFPKIVNVKFTAEMEKDLDVIEEGKIEWVKVLHEFYDDFDKTLSQAKEKMKDVKIRLKEDETDLICEKCGRKMVVKVGRYGKFIACSGYPECKNTKKFVVETGAECPKCGGKVIVKKSKKGRTFYGCENYPNCDFVSWDEPTKEKCPKCSKTLLMKKGKNKKLYCVTEKCGYEKSVDK